MEVFPRVQDGSKGKPIYHESMRVRVLQLLKVFELGKFQRYIPIQQFDFIGYLLVRGYSSPNQQPLIFFSKLYFFKSFFIFACFLENQFVHLKCGKNNPKKLGMKHKSLDHPICLFFSQKKFIPKTVETLTVFA